MTGPFHPGAYAPPVTRAEVEADFPQFSFGVFTDPPGQVWADFTHDTDEFVVVAQGEVEIEVDGDVALCGPGDLVRIPAGVAHTLRTSPAAGSTWFYGYGHFGGADG
jgi:quercetin dioxygenase-like cupin family protein